MLIEGEGAPPPGDRPESASEVLGRRAPRAGSSAVLPSVCRRHLALQWPAVSVCDSYMCM